MVFVAEDSSTAHTKDLDVQTPVPGRLVLKIGAQVMLLKNISIGKGLVNGARGVVKRFETGVPVVKFRNVEYVAKVNIWNFRQEKKCTPNFRATFKHFSLDDFLKNFAQQSQIWSIFTLILHFSGINSFFEKFKHL